MKNLAVILSTLLLSTVSFAADSVYTSVQLKDCITLDSSEYDVQIEIDYLDSVCRGEGPYTVKYSGGDARYGISLLYRGQLIPDLTKTTQFHDLGSKVVEWRYKNGALKALIFRIAAGSDGINNDLLHVVKLDAMNSCTVAVLQNESNSNIKARAIADNIQAYSCL